MTASSDLVAELRHNAHAEASVRCCPVTDTVEWLAICHIAALEADKAALVEELEKRIKVMKHQSGIMVNLQAELVRLAKHGGDTG